MPIQTTTQNKSSRIFADVENYIYAYHLNQFLVLPMFPEDIRDDLQAQWSSTTPLARSAPIQSYSSSGPRTVNFSFTLHRDFMNQVNYEKSNMILPKNDDYLDTVINCIQALSVPTYTDASKMVNPPLVAVRIGDQMFCKGVMQSANITYKLPVIQTKSGSKYAVVDLSFAVVEVDAYDATYIAKHGSFRGLSSSLERKIASLSGNQTAISLSDITRGGGTSVFSRRTNAIM